MAERHGILIGGRLRSTGRVLDVFSPYDGALVGGTYLASLEEFEDACATAQAAYEELKTYTAYKRATLINAVVDGIEANCDDLARTIALEAGKPIKDARIEVKRAQNTFQLALEEAKRMEGAVVPLDVSPDASARIGIIRRFPLGVVLGISPFNFPLNLVAHKVAPAMASGNAIILKPSPRTPLSALKLGDIIMASGWPAGGVNVVPCDNADVGALLSDARIKKLSFTGSSDVGWALKEKAGRKKVTLELGGNAGAIVEGDADALYAAKRCAIGAFSNAGQVCISVQRIYVQREVYHAFKEAFIRNAVGLRMGDPLDESTDIGPMIDEASARRAEEWVKEAVRDGAIILAGGKRNNNFMEPTVLTNTRPSMKVCAQELFATVVALESYDDFEEALNAVNSSRFGLQAGVFTNDMKKVFKAYDTLDVGAVVVNDAPTFRVDNMPYGGVKESGFGREGVRYAIEEMTEPRLLVVGK
ncbi:MAG: aldehyde dehydrogenase family protein [Deltaproteobacteria bacterium]|nr:aldehyde dehydrogenase family protein [Deltaproteobacteria bacterium]